jgi:hypothetical protein
MQPLTIIIEQQTLLRIMVLSFTGFLMSMLLTPIYTTLAYKYEWWKRVRTDAVTGEKAKMYTALHAVIYLRWLV